MIVRRPLEEIPPRVEEVRADLADEQSLRVRQAGIRAMPFISPHDAVRNRTERKALMR